MWTLTPLAITDDERLELERRVRAPTTAQRMVRRCLVVLMAADGTPNRRIAPEVGLSEIHVAVWRRRFDKDRLAGLDDCRRSGRPRVYGHDERLKIVARRRRSGRSLTASGVTGCWPIVCPIWGSRPPRLGGSWPSWISSRIRCGAG
jgi:hypothetical protein